jgi:hypothetical protein
MQPEVKNWYMRTSTQIMPINFETYDSNCLQRVLCFPPIPFHDSQFTEPVPDFLLSSFSNCTGHQKHNAGFFYLVGLTVIIFVQNGENDFSIIDIHLTSIDLYVNCNQQ